MAILPLAVATKALCSTTSIIPKFNDNVINKAGKCVFAYNANYDKIFANHFENCQIGIHFTAAIEGTTLYEIHLLTTKARLNMSAPASSIGVRAVAATIGAITAPLTLTATASATVPTVRTGLSTKSSGAHPSLGY